MLALDASLGTDLADVILDFLDSSSDTELPNKKPPTQNPLSPGSSRANRRPPLVSDRHTPISANMNQQGKPPSSSLLLSGDSHIIRLGVSVSGESRKRAHLAMLQAAAETEKGGEDSEPRVLRRSYSEPYNSISSIF